VSNFWRTQRIRLWRRALLATPLALAAVAVGMAEHSDPARQSVQVAPTVSSQALPASSPTSHITVNGQHIPTGPDGSTHVSLPSSGTQVDAHGGSTVVSSHDSVNGTTSVSTSDGGNMSVDINSSSHEGSGGDGSSTSFSSTNVFSAGSSYSHTSEP
jgi:hypothetical protein